MPVIRATESQQKKYGVKLWIKSEWRSRPKQIANLHCSKWSNAGKLDERQARDEFIEYATRLSRQEGNLGRVDIEAMHARVERQRSLMAICDPDKPRGLIAEGENDLTRAIAAESVQVAEIGSATVAAQNAALVAIEAIDVLTSNPDDWRNIPFKPRWCKPTINETVVDYGFSPEYTQAALAAGMTIEEIEKRDREATMIAARHRLQSGEWPTAELIAAANYPADYFDSCDEIDDDAPVVKTAMSLSALRADSGKQMNLDNLSYDAETDIGKTFLPADMQAWRNRLGFTQKSAAERLDITERTIRNYEIGAQPIPRVVALACWALAVSLAA